MSTITVMRPVPGTTLRQPAPGWFARWVERARRERQRRRLQRSADALLLLAGEHRSSDPSYAADLEAAALDALDAATGKGWASYTEIAFEGIDARVMVGRSLAGQILEVSNIHAASDTVDLDLNTDLSLGGPAQSTLRDALRAADSDTTMRSRSPRGHSVSIDGDRPTACASPSFRCAR